MLAGHIPEPGRIELVEVPEPSLDDSPGGEIIFQPEMACLCGSDLPYFCPWDEQGPHPLEPGYSLHEMVGTVVASSGARFHPGDRVLAVPIRQKGFFQRYRLSEERAIAWDARCPAELAVLAQPLGTVLYAHRKIPGTPGKDVVVLGQGPIGQMHDAVLRAAGARRVIGIDLLASRLETSGRMGATHTIDASVEDAPARVAELTGGRLADVVIECVGHRDQALNACIDLCRPDGEILYFGVPPETIDGVEWHRLFMKNLTVHTSVDPDFAHDFPLAMQWLAERRIDLLPLITHRFPLERIQEAYEVFRDRRDGAQKVMLEFPSGAD